MRWSLVLMVWRSSAQGNVPYLPAVLINWQCGARRKWMLGRSSPLVAPQKRAVLRPGLVLCMRCDVLRLIILSIYSQYNNSRSQLGRKFKSSRSIFFEPQPQPRSRPRLGSKLDRPSLFASSPKNLSSGVMLLRQVGTLGTVHSTC